MAGSLSGLPKCGAPFSVNSLLCGGLQHHAHGRGHRLEALEVLPGQHARVQVRQQAGLLQHPDRHGPDVGQGVVVAVGVQPLPRLGPSLLWLVTQREQGLLAAHGRALAGDGEHLVRLQVQAVQAVRDGGERAVAAAVPAQPGQRDEDLARVSDDVRSAGRLEPRVAGPARVAEEGVQVLAARVEQDRRLVPVERLAVPGPRQCPAHRGWGDFADVADVAGAAGVAGLACHFAPGESAGFAGLLRLSDVTSIRVAAENTHPRTLRGKLPRLTQALPGGGTAQLRLDSWSRYAGLADASWTRRRRRRGRVAGVVGAAQASSRVRRGCVTGASRAGSRKRS